MAGKFDDSINSSSAEPVDTAARLREFKAWQAKQKGAAPAPAKTAAPKPKPKASVDTEDRESGIKSFRDSFRASTAEKPRASGPKPGSEAYVDRQVADDRASKARMAAGKKSLDSVSMLDKSAPDTLRKEVFGAAASIPAGAGVKALSNLNKADRAAGYLGKAGQEALKGLKKRGVMMRNAKKARDYKDAQAGGWNDTYGLGLRKGGTVKAFRKGGKVKEANMEKRHVNFMKKAGAPKKMIAEEAAEERKYAKGGVVRGGGCAKSGKNFRMR